MNCQTARGQFDERLDGRLTSEEQSALQAHLDTCPACHNEWNLVSRLWERLGTEPGSEPAFGFAERTVRRLEEPVPVKVRWLEWLMVHRAAGAWACLAILAVGSWVSYNAIQQKHRAEVYARVGHGDYLEDFDVIANLDQLGGNNRL